MKGYRFLNSASNEVAFSVSMLTYATNCHSFFCSLYDIGLRCVRSNRTQQQSECNSCDERF